MDLSNLIVLLSLYPLQILGLKCALPSRTIYVRNEGYYYESNGMETVMKEVTLSECASHCTSRTKEGNCTLFEYDAMLLRCVLKNGTDDVMDDSKMHRKFDHNIALFQQLCLPDEQICPSPYAFERFPGFILLGIAKEVIKYASLEECLNICLSVKTRTEMECRSVMYYYDTGECILNSDNQVTSGTMLTNNTSNMRVDYFENYCLDVKCPSSSTMHWIKVSGFKINDKHNILMEHVTKEECCNYCRKNEVDGQIFPCKLYAYNEDRMTCYLTSKSGLANLPMSLPDDELIDNLKKYEYYEKICLQGSTRCQDSSFEHTSNHALLTEANKVIITTSVANCLDICLRSGKQCSSVMFFHSKDECVLNTISQDSNAQQLQYYPEVDYFDNVCDYKINMNLSLKSTVSEFSSSIHSKLNGTSGAQIVETQALYLSLNQNLFGNSEHEGLLLNNSNLKSMLETLETDCGAESIVINMQFDKPTNGAIFIKDHFATCHFEYVNSLYARMKIALVTLHQDNPPCPGYEINPSIWSFIVVVQKNDLGVPALMTDTDRIFNISCDYSNIHIAGSSEHDKMLSSDSSRDWSSSLASTDQVQLTVLRGDQPVSTAVMGEELEIKWTIMQDNENDVEMFVNRCIAERLDGIPPLPPSLTLISNGCIENKVRKSLMQHPIVHDDSGLSTKIKVFRFDGSHRVRILCSVDICAENCSPATCNNMDNGSILHFSKKKRQSLNYVAQKISNKYVRRQIIVGAFTIDEMKNEIKFSDKAVDFDQQKHNHNKRAFQLPENKHLCSCSIAFYILIAAAVILLAMQIFLLCKCLRFRSRKSVPSGSEGSYNDISPAHCVYFGQEEYSCSLEPSLKLSRISKISSSSLVTKFLGRK